MHAAILVIEGDGIMFRPEAGLGPNATHVSTAEGTVRHVYDDRWQVVADIGAQGDVIASYVWGDGIDSLLAVKVGGASYYPLTDIQGTVWGYADTNNAVVARWTYDAWGNVLDEEVAVPALARLRYRFQGREWSAATGLVNFRMRWYDPETGRWLSKDPIGLSGGLNLYAFCGNDPLNNLDPFGMSFWKPFLKGFIRGAVIAAAVTVIAMAASAVAGAAAVALGCATMAATVSSTVSITLTIGITAASAYGAFSGGVAMARAIKCDDTEAIATVTGEMVGGLVVGGLVSRGMVSRIAGKPSEAPPMYDIPAAIRFERASAYNPNYPNGSVGKWLGTAPTPLANTAALGLVGMSERPQIIGENVKELAK